MKDYDYSEFSIHETQVGKAGLMILPLRKFCKNNKALCIPIDDPLNRRIGFAAFPKLHFGIKPIVHIWWLPLSAIALDKDSHNLLCSIDQRAKFAEYHSWPLVKELFKNKTY